VDESIPVPGWDADLKPIRADHMKNALMVESYFVKRCPEFLPDGAERRRSCREESMQRVHKAETDVPREMQTVQGLLQGTGRKTGNAAC